MGEARVGTARGRRKSTAKQGASSTIARNWLDGACWAHTSLACVIGRGLMMCCISSFHRPFLTSRPGLSAFSRRTRSLFGACTIGSLASWRGCFFPLVGIQLGLRSRLVPDSLVRSFLRANCVLIYRQFRRYIRFEE